MPPLIDPLAPAAARFVLADQLDVIGDQAAGLVGKLAQHNLDALNAIQATTDGIAVKLGGAVQGQLNGLELRGQKTVGKLQKERNRLLGNAYQSIFPHGGSWQPIEHVVAGVSTGDIWGPVGLLPPGQTEQPMAPFVLPGDDDTIVKPIPVGPPPLPVQIPPGGGGGGGGVNPGGGVIAGGGGLVPPGGIIQPGGGGLVPPGGILPGGGGGGVPPIVPGGGGGIPPVIPPGNNYYNGCYSGAPINADGNMGPFPWGDGNQPCCLPGWSLVYGPPGSKTYMCYAPIGTGGGGGGFDPPPLPPPIPPDPGDDCPPCAPPPPPPPDPTCAPPPKPTQCPPGMQPGPPRPAPETEHCDWLATMLGAWGDLPDQGITGLGMAAGVAANSPLMKQIVGAITGGEAAILPDLVTRFAAYASEMLRQVVHQVPCDITKIMPLVFFRAACALVNKYTDIIPPQLSEFTRQLMDTACQTKLPSPSEANAAWLADTITTETWECYQKAGGNLVDDAKTIRNAARTRPNAREVDLLFRRELIDIDEYNTRMRQGGVTNQLDAQRISELNLQYPDRADLIRFMVRDVFDDNVVQQSGLDTDFDLKFAGDALKYAAALGIPENHLRYAWRAHWQLPSLTMAGQMLARCRPGRVPDNAVVTEEDVVQLLKQDDWAPAWIPSMMEIVKQPLTRVDTRRMYQIHKATEDELKEYYLDLRYSDRDADQLVEFAKAQRDIAEAKASGLPTQRTAIMQFARGELTERELVTILNKTALTPELAKAGQDSAELARTVYRRTQTIKGVRKQFVAGLVDDVEAMVLLNDAQVDGDEINDLIEMWRLDQRDKGKHASAAQLCKWRELNIITPVQQLKALERTGWHVDDATRIVSQCDMQLSEKARKQAIAAAKEAMKQYEKLQAEELKALKAKGKVPGPPSRRIIIVRGKGEPKVTDTTTVPVLPGAEDIAAAGGNP